MPTEKQMELASRRFNSACKQASRCRADKRILSCAACSEVRECEIQERVNKNLAIKRGEIYIKKEYGN